MAAAEEDVEAAGPATKLFTKGHDSITGLMVRDVARRMLLSPWFEWINGI